jgi:hypothetical protein
LKPTLSSRSTNGGTASDRLTCPAAVVPAPDPACADLDALGDNAEVLVGVGGLVAVRDEVDLGPVQKCPSLVQRHLEEEPQDRHGLRLVDADKLRGELGALIANVGNRDDLPEGGARERAGSERSPGRNSVPIADGTIRADLDADMQTSRLGLDLDRTGYAELVVARGL